MIKRPLLACLAALVFSARADAIPFFDVRYDATAVAATADGPPGVDMQSSTTAADIISASAASLGATTAVATAGAIAGPGLLTTSADVSADDIGNAVATAHFTGSFLNGSAVSLSVDFTRADAASGSGAGSTTLFVSLTSNGATLFEDYVSGPWAFSYAPALGTTSVLDLTLASEASAAFPDAGAGNGSAFGLVTIAGAVPEASTWLMFALGLGALGAAGSRARRQAQPA